MEVVKFTLQSFYPGEKVAGTHCVGGRREVEKKMLSAWNLTQAVQPADRHYTVWK
jgi:hypothetical protein